jgi:hypothetical protein
MTLNMDRTMRPDVTVAGPLQDVELDAHSWATGTAVVKDE